MESNILSLKNRSKKDFQRELKCAIEKRSMMDLLFSTKFSCDRKNFHPTYKLSQKQLVVSQMRFLTYKFPILLVNSEQKYSFLNQVVFQGNQTQWKHVEVLSTIMDMVLINSTWNMKYCANIHVTLSWIST